MEITIALTCFNAAATVVEMLKLWPHTVRISAEQKMKFSIKDFFSRISADLVTLTEEILNEKTSFFVQWSKISVSGEKVKYKKAFGKPFLKNIRFISNRDKITATFSVTCVLNRRSSENWSLKKKTTTNCGLYLVLNMLFTVGASILTKLTSWFKKLHSWLIVLTFCTKIVIPDRFLLLWKCFT